MAIPRLSYSPSSQNQRVKGYEMGGDEQPKRYNLDNLTQTLNFEEVVWAAYRQIWNEQQILDFNREKALESQLRNGQITMRGFVRGLLLSDNFRRLIYEANSNYRLVEICVQRVLGRYVYGDREKFAWSTLIATEGFEAFVDQLLDSDEYFENFGDSIVPYQRRRVLPQKDSGDLPFARMSRYDENYLNTQFRLGLMTRVNPMVVDNSSRVYRRVLFILSVSSILLLILTIGLAVG